MLPTQAEIFGTTYSWLSPLYGVFVVSTVVRAAVVMWLVPKLRVVRNVRLISIPQVIFRVTGINALAGVFFDIVGSRPRQSEPADGDNPRHTREAIARDELAAGD